MKYLIYGIILLFAAFLLGLFIRSLPDAISRAREGEQKSREAACQVLFPETANAILGGFPHPAPMISLQNRQGTTVTLSSLRGKVVLIHFWSTSCPECMREWPALEKMNKQLQGKPFVFVAISEDATWEDLDPFYKKDSSMLMLLDLRHEAASHYGVAKLPQSFLLDKEGRIRYSMTGLREEWATEEGINCIRAFLK